MGNEPQKKVDTAAGWSMPEPVFQTSEGRPPGKRVLHDPEQEITTQPGLVDPEADIPTEPGFRTADPEAEIPTDPGLRDPDDDVVGSVDDYLPKSTKPSRAGGCAKTMLSVVGIVAIAIIGFICLLVYLIFYYRPAGSNF